MAQPEWHVGSALNNGHAPTATACRLSAKKIDVVRRGAVGPLKPRNQTSRCLIARVRNRPQTASRPQRPLPDGSLQIVVRGVKEDPGDPTV